MAAALLLHGLLLLVPAQRALQPDGVLRRLSVSLSAVRPPPRAEDPRSQTQDPGAAAEVAEPVAPPPPTPMEPPATAAPPAGEAAAAVPPVPSTARLLENAYRTLWELPETGRSRRLGEPAPDLQPEGWRPVPESRGRGEAARASAALEIVDRWLAADGSHNVLIKTRSGDLLCGRAEARDPLQPLVEPVFMFRTCGSGQSTFAWPERYRPGTGRRGDAGGNP